jgi:hypothetical protein
MTLTLNIYPRNPKMAAFAPMPSASVNTATPVNRGLLRRILRPSANPEPRFDEVYTSCIPALLLDSFNRACRIASSQGTPLRIKSPE